jgi:hypothetical protein
MSEQGENIPVYKKTKKKATKKGRGVKLMNAAHGTGSKRGQRKKKTEPRQQLKNKRNATLHQEWILQQGVNKAAAKKKERKKTKSKNPSQRERRR